jgi:hypothetical protein
VGFWVVACWWRCHHHSPLHALTSSPSIRRLLSCLRLHQRDAKGWVSAASSSAGIVSHGTAHEPPDAACAGTWLARGSRDAGLRRQHGSVSTRHSQDNIHLSRLSNPHSHQHLWIDACVPNGLFSVRAPRHARMHETLHATHRTAAARSAALTAGWQRSRRSAF